MVEEMRFASLLAKGAYYQPEALDAPTTLRMATLEGAKALGMDHITGSIEKGKSADLILVHAGASNMQPLHNPCSAIVYAASDIVMCMGTAASLSYLGIGVEPTTPEWGAIINGGNAFTAGLNPLTDTIFVEDVNPETNPAVPDLVNVIVARTEDKDNETYLKIVEAYHTAEVQETIEEEYQGAFVCAWEGAE